MKALRFAASIALVAAIVSVYHWLLPVNSTTVALTLLMAILGISTFWGLAEATAASVAAVFGFNFYFLPPVGTLTIQDPQNWVALMAFLATAVTASQLSAHARRRREEAEQRRLEIERLYDLVRATMLSGDVRHIVQDFVHRVAQSFGCAAAAYCQPLGEIFRSGDPAAGSDADLVAAAEMEEASRVPAKQVAVSPVRLGGRSLGAIALTGTLPVDTVRAIANLLAITIEKARALEEASRAEAARQSESLKSSLLDSLAHDIKTPLTSIKAAVTSLLRSNAADPELLTIIDEEADRLNHMAAEMVAMARIEAGKLHLDKRKVAVAELISAALEGLGPAAHPGRVTLNLAPGLPMAFADPEFMEQVLKQLVQNALKYTPAEFPVAIDAAPKNGKIVVSVADRGAGIDENERALIFDKFYRGRRHRFDTNGTGMGLAIAKGIIEAHRERLWVESERGHGSAFYFTMAAAGPAPVEPAAIEPLAVAQARAEPEK